jgi:hypothetical protein
LKKDIEIPLVSGVFVAAVLEENKEFRSRDWNAYIINSKDVPLEMVLIMARGYDKKDTTSTMRHTIQVLPAKSFVKIEYMQTEVLRLNNEFLITFFEGNKMFEKKYVFRKNSVKESLAGEIPVMHQKGILAK